MLLELRLTSGATSPFSLEMYYLRVYFWQDLLHSLHQNKLFENPQESSRMVSQTKNQCLRTVGGDALSECSLLFLSCVSESAFSPHLSSTFSIF